MKATKGIWVDNRPEEQPEGTYPFGKNGIQYDIAGAVFNEPGFAEWIISIPGTIIGCIETDQYPVVMLVTPQTDASNFCQIGYFNTDTQTYVEVIQDSDSWASAPGSSGLGFTQENYITGQFQKNYIGQRVITFTDKVQFPMFLNLDNPNLSTKNDLRLFPIFQNPIFSVDVQIGGILLPGAYYVAIGYDRNDGTSTAYSEISAATIVPEGPVAGVGNSALVITVTDCDQSYDLMRVAIISKIAGVVTAVELTDYLQVTSGTIELTYDGTNLSSTITVEQILTPPAVYDTVRAIGQLNDLLYIGGLTSPPDYDDMQMYALMVNLEWVSQIASGTSPTSDQATGIQRGEMHEEVYAHYIRYRKVLGGYTKWYVIPGPPPLSEDLAVSSEATTGGYTGSTPALKFQVEDSIPYVNPTTLADGSITGGYGCWQNSTELYPDTAYFDTTSIGGPNFRGQPVRHHKTPSLRWCRTNLYPGNTAYGITELDLLGVQATGVRIPAEYANLIDGYQIGYAIRNIGNQINYGQGLMLHCVTDNYEVSQSDTIALMYTSGGNWMTSVTHGGGASHDDNLSFNKIRTNTFRIHPFDVLFNQPAIDPTFISGQMQYQSWNTQPDNNGQGVIALDGAPAQTLPQIALFDYTKSTKNPTANGTGKTLRAITASSYLPIGLNALNFINAQHENVFAGRLAGTAWPQDVTKYFSIRTTGGGSGPPESYVPQYEQAYLVNLIALKQDLYNAFYSQTLATAGATKAIGDGSPFWQLDTFVVGYTWHTYGRHDANDFAGAGIGGKKIVRYIVCESASNLHQRFVTTGNIYSEYYPNNSLTPQNNAPGQAATIDYPYNYDRSQDPNQFGYDKSLNAINSLVDSTTYNPFANIVLSFPYRIHRGGLNTRVGRPRSWRTFQPLDYYEMVKNMGLITHIEGMDDRLIIHMQNAMFLTQDKAALTNSENGTATSIIQLTLGTADIFQFQPQEAMSSKMGYAGTLHDLACVKTPFGYVFVDAGLGEMYLYKGKLENLNLGMNTFLRDQLKQLSTNAYIGNGITIGWDQKYKRILLTVKNLQLSTETTIIPFMNTNSFFESLQVGDIVYYQGRYIQYTGPNSSSYDCPVIPTSPTITWEAIDPFCLTSGGVNTGYQGWTNRQQFTNGVLTLTEANSPTGGVGPYFPPVLNTGSCPIPPPVITWEPSGLMCEQTSAATCEEGWVLSPDETTCSQTETQSPTITESEYCVASSTNGAYSSDGTRIYNPGWTTADIENPTPPAGVLAALLLTPYWQNATFTDTLGPMNRAGVWMDQNCTGTLSPLAAGEKVTLSFEYQNNGGPMDVFIGCGGDNEFQVILNGATIAQTDGSGNTNNFDFWHVFPITLISGYNLINLVGIGDGSVSDSIGFIVYNNTLAEMEAATSDAGLDILYNSYDQIAAGKIDVATCPVGWSLDTSGGAGSYVCKKTITEAPTQEPVGNSGYAVGVNRCEYSNGVATGYCEPNTDGGGEGPYLPPFLDTDICPTSNPTPGNVNVTGTVSVGCSDPNCVNPGETFLTFNLDTPAPSNLSIWVGAILTQSWDASQVGFGKEIFPGGVYPAGVTGWTYLGNDQYAMEVDIPAGATSFTITSINQEAAATVSPTDWQCQPCLTPVSALYLHLELPTSGVTLELTSGTTGVTVNIV